MQGVRPNFCCTVCHQQFEGLYDFKDHLESQEHELAYGIRLRNSMVGSYFCNCCHICVNTLLIWKSHIMGTKHMKIACAFSLAYSNFDFDKPAKIKDVGVLDQNVVVPESIQRSNGRPSSLVRPIDHDLVLIGVTDMVYTAPGLYHCNLCDEPFNEGNKTQHIGSCRHRTNVFKRWDIALYEEAMSVKEVGKPEFSARCESIASEIFPVEQQVLNKEQQLLYQRLMGTSTALDEQYYSELQPNNTSQPSRPPGSDYKQQRGPPQRGQPQRDPHSSRGPPPPRDYNRTGPPDRRRNDYNNPDRDEYDYHGTQKGPGRNRNTGRRDRNYNDRDPGREQGRSQERPFRDRPNTSQPVNPVTIDSDIKCDLAMECVRVLLQNLNVFVSETRNTSFTRVEVLKAQILYEEVLKMAYPESQKAQSDENYITVFHNGRLTLKRKEGPKKLPLPPAEKPNKAEGVKPVEDKPKDLKPSSSAWPSEIPSTQTSGPPLPPSPKGAPPSKHSTPLHGAPPHGAPLHGVPPHGAPLHGVPPHGAPVPGAPVPPHVPHQAPPTPMFDPWGRPIMMHPGDVHRMPFFPPAPDYYRGFDKPRERSSERSRERSPRRGSSPRKRTPPPVMEISREQKRPRSRTPERVVTLKAKSPLKMKAPERTTRSPGRISESRKSPSRHSPHRSRRSPPRRSPGRRSPLRKSPGRRSPLRKSPGRKSPGRKSPGRKSPGRKSPGRRSPGPARRSSSSRRSPRRKSPSRRSPRRRSKSPGRSKEKVKQEDGDGTLFLDEGAYAELLESLG